LLTIAINIFRLQNRRLTICLPMRVNVYQYIRKRPFASLNTTKRSWNNQNKTE